MIDSAVIDIPFFVLDLSNLETASSANHRFGVVAVIQPARAEQDLQKVVGPVRTVEIRDGRQESAVHSPPHTCMNIY